MAAVNLARFREWWRAQSVWVRTGAVVALLTLAGWAAWRSDAGSEPQWQPLFADLQPQDAAAIVERLEQEAIPYRLADQGRAVLVPAEEVHRLRLRLAAEGMPTGGVLGFELFDQSRFGDTEFDRRIRFLRALQGELARTIQQIEGVEAARVHVVLPEPSLFLSEQQPASAAVLLKLRPGAQLGAEQVRAVVNLVAGSVEGLKPENVTVVDVRGRLLSAGLAGVEPDGPVDASSALAAQREVEGRLQRELQALLEQVLGPGNVVTRVAVELNLDRLTVERELFEPARPEGVLRSVQELRERFEGSGTPPGGVPGAGANGEVPTYPIAVGSGQGTYERDESVRNFEVNRVVEHRVVAPGAVRRLSVSVVVNGTLKPDQEQAIRDLVAAAIGFDPQRADQVAVIGMPFDTSLAERLGEQLEQEAPSAERRPQGAGVPVAVLAAVAGVLLALALGAWWLARARVRRRLAALEQEMLARLEQERRRLQEAAAANGRRKQAGVAASIEDAARQDPERVARLLRVWLAEG